MRKHFLILMLMALLPFTAWAEGEPTAKENLVYDGSAQELLNAGTTTGKHFFYAAVLNDAAKPGKAAYAAAVPTETNAADYDVYYVMKDADEPVTDDEATAAVKIDASIAKKQIVYYLTGNTYNVGDVIDVTNHYSLASGYDFVTIGGVKEKLADYAEFKFYTTGNQNVIPVDANGCLTTKGTFPVSALRVVWNENVKHNYDFRFTSSAQIVVAAMSIANFYAVTTESFTYDGNPKTLANEPKLFRTQADAADPSKALVKGTDYTVEYRKNTNAGEAEFVFKATQSGNYDEEKIVYFTIKKADIKATDFTAPTAIAGLSYNATEKTLIKAGSIANDAGDATKKKGTFYYQLEGSNDWVTTLPQATNAKTTDGGYAVKWKIVGGDNYKDYSVTTPGTQTTAEVVTSEWTVKAPIAKAMLVIQPKQAKNVLYTGAAPDLSDVELTYTKFFGDDTKALFGSTLPRVKVAQSIITANYPKGNYAEGLEIDMTGVAALANYEVYPVNGALNITAKNVKVQLNGTWQKTADFGTTAASAPSWDLLASEASKLTVNVQTGYDANNAPVYSDAVADPTQYLKTTTGTSTNPSKFDGLTISRANTSTAVGKYPVTISGAQPIDDNYVIVSQTVAEAIPATSSSPAVPAPTFEIKAKAITIKAANKAMVYGSATEPTLTWTSTATLDNNQTTTINNAIQRVAGDNVGVYEINFKKGVTTGDGPEIEGFTITYETGAFAITPATLTITADDQTLYTGNTVTKLDQNEYDVDGLKKGDTTPVVELSFAPNVPVYSFTSYMTNDQEQTTLCTGKVKFVSVDTQNNKTTVEVIENTTQNANVSEDDAAAFVGNQYIVEGTDLTNGTTFQLLTTENAPTGLSVKNVALVPAESGVTVDADKKLTLAGTDPSLTIKNGIVATVKNTSAFEQNYELVVVYGDLKVVNSNYLLVLSTTQNNADAIDAAKDKTVAVNFGERTLKANTWYTMVLPFAVKTTELVTNLKALDAATTAVPHPTTYHSVYAIVNRMNESTTADKINFTLEMMNIPANEPFLIKVAEDVDLKNVEFTEKKIVKANPIIEYGGNEFIGTYAAVTDLPTTYNTTDKHWGFLATGHKGSKGQILANTWWNANLAGLVINPLEAYLHYAYNPTGAAPVITIEDYDFETGTTAIKTLDVESMKAYSVDGWYTLNGIKLQGVPTEKGIYINNGKKVVIK